MKNIQPMISMYNNPAESRKGFRTLYMLEDGTIIVMDSYDYNIYVRVAEVGEVLELIRSMIDDGAEKVSSTPVGMLMWQAANTLKEAGAPKPKPKPEPQNEKLKRAMFIKDDSGVEWAWDGEFIWVWTGVTPEDRSDAGYYCNSLEEVWKVLEEGRFIS